MMGRVPKPPSGKHVLWGQGYHAFIMLVIVVLHTYRWIALGAPAIPFGHGPYGIFRMLRLDEFCAVSILPNSPIKKLVSMNLATQI